MTEKRALDKFDSIQPSAHANPSVYNPSHADSSAYTRSVHCDFSVYVSSVHYDSPAHDSSHTDSPSYASSHTVIPQHTASHHTVIPQHKFTAYSPLYTAFPRHTPTSKHRNPSPHDPLVQCNQTPGSSARDQRGHHRLCGNEQERPQMSPKLLTY